MSDIGPVCHIPPANTPGNPQPTALPGMPAPAAATVQSLQQVVNQLRQIIMYMTGQNGSNGQNGSSAASGGSFTQKSIATETVKIYQNNDPTTGNFVEVERVNQLVLADKAKNTWTYNRAG